MQIFGCKKYSSPIIIWRHYANSDVRACRLSRSQRPAARLTLNRRRTATSGQLGATPAMSRLLAGSPTSVVTLQKPDEGVPREGCKGFWAFANLSRGPHPEMKAWYLNWGSVKGRTLPLKNVMFWSQKGKPRSHLKRSSATEEPRLKSDVSKCTKLLTQSVHHFSWILSWTATGSLTFVKIP